MEVTFDIDERVLEVLQLEAASRGKTVSAVVESALSMALPQGPLTRPKTNSSESDRKELPPLPTWKAELMVDVSNRDELYRVLDDDVKFGTLYGLNPEDASGDG